MSSDSSVIIVFPYNFILRAKMALFYGFNNYFIIFRGNFSFIFGLLKNKFYFCITMSSGFKFD